MVLCAIDDFDLKRASFHAYNRSAEDCSHAPHRLLAVHSIDSSQMRRNI
jgi:hypothetical protein